MSKATLILLTLTALGLGGLVGVSLVDEEEETTNSESVAVIAPASTGGAPVYRYLSPDDLAAAGDADEIKVPFTLGENFIGYEERWKSESLSIELAADSRVEYKIFMSQGDSVVFHWEVGGEDIYYDFHAHDAAFGDEFYTRYDDGRGTSRSGSIVAPYDGQHGWYWQNLEPDDATINLEVAGYFDKIIAIDLE